jgi:RNA polymerase sigma factor (sigma-70 family)
LKILPVSPQRNQSQRQVVDNALISNLDALYSAACRVTGRTDLAEDLVQDTARKALEASPDLRDEQKVRGWLMKILLNHARDLFRQTAKWEGLDAAEEEEELALGIEGDSLSQATVHDVRTAVERLSPERRALVILVDVEEFTILDAADALKIPPGTAASRLARAHRQLREFLAGKIARCQLPEHWAFITEVPKTSVGKFDKKVLRARYAAGELEVTKVG